MELDSPAAVLIPATNAVNPDVHIIAARSGIVGTQQADGTWTLDFEGRLYGAAASDTFADRVHIAFGRHTTSYPTVARRAAIPNTDVTMIGLYDPVFGRIRLIDGFDRAQLCAWLEMDEAQIDEQLCTTGLTHTDLRTAQSWPLDVRRQLRHLPSNLRRKYEKAGLI